MPGLRQTQPQINVRNMISERVYWAALIVAFAGFSVLVWYKLVPDGAMEYNLGVNFFTGSIFTMVTIVFLTWLYGLSEKARWKIVKEEVFFSIERSLGNLFNVILLYHQRGPDIRKSIMMEKSPEDRKRICLAELKHLKEEKEAKFDRYYIKDLIDNKRTLEFEFLSVARRLDSVETKYSKFLSPQFIRSLMKMQDAFSDIEVATLFGSKNKEPKKSEDGEQLDPEEFESTFEFRFVASAFKALIEELYNLRSAGIEFSI